MSQIHMLLCMKPFTILTAEAVFGVSGVLAVVVVGIVLSSEKTSISPEVEKFLHRLVKQAIVGSK